MAKPHSSGGNGLLWEKSLDPAVRSWTRIGHAQRAVALAAVDVPGQGRRLFCATWDNLLWVRDLGSGDVPWRPLTQVRNATALAAVHVPGEGPQLFCAATDNLIYRKDALSADGPWQPAGEAAGVVALAALDMPEEGIHLFCITHDDRLYQREAGNPHTCWCFRGSAEGARAGRCQSPRPGAAPVPGNTRPSALPPGRRRHAASWQRVGGAQDVVAMAALDDRLICVTRGEETKLAAIPHQVFLPVRKEVRLTAGMRAEEARRLTVTDGFGTCLACWAGSGEQRLGETAFHADQGTTPGVLVVDVLWERQHVGDPGWYGSQCVVSHRRGGRTVPDELTVAGDGCWLTFEWFR